MDFIGGMIIGGAATLFVILRFVHRERTMTNETNSD